jgi:exonuclease SbcD
MTENRPVVLMGDFHLADRAPSSRQPTWTEDLLRKLDWIVKKANELEAPLIMAGDVFHIKMPYRSSYKLVQAVHDRLLFVEQGVWIVPGNHDLTGDNLDSLDSQPLGALARMGNVKLLMGLDDELAEKLGYHVLGIPYLSAFDGGDWKKALSDWSETLPLKLTKIAALTVTHAPLFPPGKAPGVYASIDPAEWAEVDPSPHTYYGHIHDAHDAYVVNGHTFANMGAIGRGSLHEETVKRHPAIAVFHPEGGFGRIELPYGKGKVVRPAEEVFLFAEAEGKVAAANSAQAFTDALGAVVMENLTVEEVLADIKSAGPPPNVYQMIQECMEVAGA